MKLIDCRNMACPLPVITVKRALEETGELRVLLDDGAPYENVSRFARNRGCEVAEQREPGGRSLTITATGIAQGISQSVASAGEKILLITSDRVGDGPEELGRLLMMNFIHTLLETALLPEKIFLMNRGVFCPPEGPMYSKHSTSWQGWES